MRKPPKSGHTGHPHNIAKAMGHVPDPKPHGGEKIKHGGDGMMRHGIDGAAHDSMAHASHHQANAHQNMHDGMSPDHMDAGYGQHMGHSHLGCNECHEGGEDIGGETPKEGAGSGESEEGADHAGGESDEG